MRSDRGPLVMYEDDRYKLLDEQFNYKLVIQDEGFHILEIEFEGLQMLEFYSEGDEVYELRVSQLVGPSKPMSINLWTDPLPDKLCDKLYEISRET